MADINWDEFTPVKKDAGTPAESSDSVNWDEFTPVPQAKPTGLIDTVTDATGQVGSGIYDATHPKESTPSVVPEQPGVLRQLADDIGNSSLFKPQNPNASVLDRTAPIGDQSSVGAVDAGLGPVRQDVVTRIKSEVAEKPLAEQAEIAKQDDITGNIAKQVLPDSVRRVEGDTLPRTRDEVMQNALERQPEYSSMTETPPVELPKTYAEHAQDLATNLFGGATKGAASTVAAVADAAATTSKLMGFDDASSALKGTSQTYDQAVKDWQGAMDEHGGKTILGKSAAIIGAIAPVMLLPESAMVQAVSMAGWFGIPAFRDTLNDQIQQGKSYSAALSHAVASFATNMLGPVIMQKGAAAVFSKVAAAPTAESALGVMKALGTAQVEAAGFSAVSEGTSRAIDAAYSEKHEGMTLDDFLANQLAFGAMRGAHLARDRQVNGDQYAASKAAEDAKQKALDAWQGLIVKAKPEAIRTEAAYTMQPETPIPANPVTRPVVQAHEKIGRLNAPPPEATKPAATSDLQSAPTVDSAIAAAIKAVSEPITPTADGSIFGGIREFKPETPASEPVAPAGLAEIAEAQRAPSQPVIEKATEAPANVESPSPVDFLSPHDLRVQIHEGKVDELSATHNFTPEAVAEVKSKLQPEDVRDHVTGFYKGEDKDPTIRRAQEYVNNGGVAHFAEADVANLGGLNAWFQNNHTKANAVYRALSDIFHEELSKVADKVIPFRHGGDEFSAVVLGGTSESIKSAFDIARNRIAVYAKDQGIDNLAHTKHPEEHRRGVGLYFGQSEILPGMHIKEIDATSSRQITEGKTRGLYVGTEYGEAVGSQPSPKGAVGRRNPENWIGGGKEVSAAPGEAHRNIPPETRAQPASGGQRTNPPVTVTSSGVGAGSVKPSVTRNAKGNLDVTGLSAHEVNEGVAEHGEVIETPEGFIVRGKNGVPLSKQQEKSIRESLIGRDVVTRKAATPNESTLFGAIRSAGGISPEYLQDITHDTRLLGTGGIFKDGTRPGEEGKHSPDEIAARLHEMGFPIDPHDTQGVAELIQKQMRGEDVLPMQKEGEQATSQEAQKQTAELRDVAKKLGLIIKARASDESIDAAIKKANNDQWISLTERAMKTLSEKKVADIGDQVFDQFTHNFDHDVIAQRLTAYKEALNAALKEAGGTLLSRRPPPAGQDMFSLESHTRAEVEAKLKRAEDERLANKEKADRELHLFALEGEVPVVKAASTDQGTLFSRKPALSGINALKREAVKADNDFKNVENRKDFRDMGLDEYLKWTDAIHNARAKFVEALVKIPDEGFALQGYSGDRMLTLTKSAQREGYWQLTRFDAKGEPWGDTQYKTKEQAIKEFVADSDTATITNKDTVPAGSKDALFSRKPAEVAKDRKELSDIFQNLGSSLGKASKEAKAAAEEHPRADAIKYIQENFHDILGKLEDAKLVEINC